jgi:hypothetical protein
MRASYLETADELVDAVDIAVAITLDLGSRRGDNKAGGDEEGEEKVVHEHLDGRSRCGRLKLFFLTRRSRESCDCIFSRCVRIDEAFRR